MKRALPFHSNAVWPPLGLIMPFIIFYAVLEGAVWLIERGFPSGKGPLSHVPELANVRTVILALAAVSYAVYRLVRFHPACNHAYAAWLRLTPWTSNKPLPAGPVHLIWQDAVVVGAIVAFAKWYAHVNPAWPATAFGLVYLGGLTLLLALTRTWMPCVVLGFLWPAMILPAAKGWPTIALLGAIIIVISYGYRGSLRTFPWEFLINPNQPLGYRGSSVLQIEIRIGGLTPPKPGWPYLALSPKVQNRRVSVPASFFTSALIGWWIYCVIVALQVPPTPGVMLVFALLAALLRLAAYCSVVAPPFNVWGRITSGRIVVPGFDKVLLVPCAVVVVAIFGAMIMRRSGSWYAVTESCLIAVIWFVLLSGGPTLQSWLLTGQHRYRPPARLGANKELLRPI